MDNDRPAQISLIKEFAGLVSDTDPGALPPEAMSEQINIFSLQKGSIESRGGLAYVSLTRLE